jgi:hypothetical protein
VSPGSLLKLAVWTKICTPKATFSMLGEIHPVPRNGEQTEKSLKQFE